MRNPAGATVKAARSRLNRFAAEKDYQWTRPAPWDAAPIRRAGARKVNNG